MIYKRKTFDLVLCGALALALLLGCSPRTVPENKPVQPDKPAVSQAASEPGSEAAPKPQSQVPDAQKPAEEPQAAAPGYIERLTRETIAKFLTPDMGEFEKAKAAFDYIIETATLDDPFGLDIWRVRGSDGPAHSFVENRSVSLLAYGVGMCEDYAAAFTLLLRGMGLEAEYVPGLTYAADGSGFVDHAWVVAKIDGVWYHLDCQLEQNITRRGRINYRYFMRGDATLSGSHRWGKNLIDSRLLTDTQNKEIAESFIAPACPQDYPTPPPHEFTPRPKPDLPALRAQVEAEIQAAGLPPLELDITPPVFGAEGYPPKA
jgi:hypothetical protein